MDRLKEIENELVEVRNFPAFKAGDTVAVSYKIKEGEKERIQQYTGVVLQRRGNGVTETFTVRKMSGSIGVHRIFPLHAPTIASIDVLRRGKVRRNKLNYLTKLSGKAARIKEILDK